MSPRWPEPVRRRKLGEALRAYARLLMEHERVNFHPLVNSMTTGVSREDLLKFIRSTGHEPRILRLPEPPQELPEGQAAPM